MDVLKNTFATILLGAVATICFNGCQTKKATEMTKSGETDQLKLGGGIIAQVGTVRSWEVYDGKKPETKGNTDWRCAIGRLAQGAYGDGSQVMISGQRQISIGANSFSMKVEAYSSYENGATQKPQGRFVEVQLLLANDGPASEEFCLQNDGTTGMQARLNLPDKSSVSPRGFLFPDLGIYDLSWAAALSGKIWVKLDPRQKTWALLLFDVPSGTPEAELLVLNAGPLKFRIPAWQKIEPSAQYYEGEILKSAGTTGKDNGNTFASGAFSFWLTADRQAVKKFSVKLKDIHWASNGKSGNAPEIELSFADFTRPILNHCINAPIPSCYDVTGAFTAPDKAAGTINLHHFATKTGAENCEFGTWRWQTKAKPAPEEK